MNRWLILSAVVLASATPAVAADAVPSADDIARAITYDRYDDSCEGPGPDNGCPMINIYGDRVRNPQCRAATADELATLPASFDGGAVSCRFELVTTVAGRWATYDQATRDSFKWRSESALFYQTAPACDVPDNALCARSWWVWPSQRAAMRR